MKNNTFGVALTKCYYCLEDDAIVMNKRLTKPAAARVEEMNGKVISMEPCQKCQEWMKQGVIFITIDDKKSEPGWNKEPMPNPYRTGGFAVVKDEAIERILSGETKEFALKHRFMFIEHEAAIQLGIIQSEEAK